MFENRPVVVVMPAGRRRYMPLVMHYLYKHKGLIDRIVFWANTRDTEDIRCLQGLADADPSFVHVQMGADGPLGRIGDMNAIRSFYTRETLDPQAIYLRIDDDICWMDEHAIPKLVEFRRHNPQYFCITANMVNSGLCSHLHSRLGVHPPEITNQIPWESAGGPLHNHASFAIGIHNRLLKDIQDSVALSGPSPLRRWKCYDRWELWECPRFGIAVTAYHGNDLLDLLGKWEGDDDEQFFSSIWPPKIGRINCICGRALVSHYAYGPQRDNGMENSDIYARYKALAGVP